MDRALYEAGRIALLALKRSRRERGAYRIIRDPDGVVSMWCLEGMEGGPFSVSFANRGRISGNLEDMPPEFVQAFIAFVKRTVRS